MKVSKEKVKIKSSLTVEEWRRVDCSCGRSYRVKPQVIATTCPWCKAFCNLEAQLKEMPDKSL